MNTATRTHAGDKLEKMSITQPNDHLADWDTEKLHTWHDRFDASKDRDRDDIATARRHIALELQRRHDLR